MEVTQADGVMGAIVRDIDLSDGADAAIQTQLRDLFLARHMLCLRGQNLSPHAFAAAGEIFGEPQVQLLSDYRLDDPDVVTIISNFNKIGGDKPHVRATHWHTDDSYLAVPAKATVLYAVALPHKPTHTGFINTRAVLENIPIDLRARIDGKIAVHKYNSKRGKAKVAVRSAEEQSKTPDVRHPLVRTHPDTGQKSLYINPNRIDHIEGLSEDESDALLDELYAFAFQEKFQHRHEWALHDMVIWDNRCTMHRADEIVDLSERREFQRLLLKGSVPV